MSSYNSSSSKPSSEISSGSTTVEPSHPHYCCPDDSLGMVNIIGKFNGSEYGIWQKGMSTDFQPLKTALHPVQPILAGIFAFSKHNNDLYILQSDLNSFSNISAAHCW
ncbi:hypothetical protein HAX54_052744 [Datura stramonium]|uniref:Uncharacterized protein n=1 Tax=Datura stramonium TaxID=4076 RepID=A0ABS8SZD5_DATST|nr:hypothetical protein [Datura stramonium]